MPIKYKPSANKYDRMTKKTTIEHFYIKCLSQEEAFKMLNDHNTKKKVKAKIRTELVRRGIKIVYRPIEETA